MTIACLNSLLKNQRKQKGFFPPASYLSLHLFTDLIRKLYLKEYTLKISNMLCENVGYSMKVWVTAQTTHTGFFS